VSTSPDAAANRPADMCPAGADRLSRWWAEHAQVRTVGPPVQLPYRTDHMALPSRMIEHSACRVFVVRWELP
jgi:hypothetical protein